LSGHDLRGKPPAGREPHGAPGGETDERAPVFGRWGWWYLLVLLDLALVIALCGWLTRTHP
jgi:hypothetical protein